MKKMIAALAALMLIFFSACAAADGESGTGGTTIQVYRLVSEGMKNDGELIRAEALTLPEGTAPLSGAIEALEAESEDPDLERSLPSGVKILSYALENGEISLEMSDEYLELGGIDKTIADYCVTLTLCALDGVEAVSLYVDGQAGGVGMTAEDVLLYDSGKNPYVKQIRLYFADSNGRYLLSEYHSLTMTEDSNLERYVIEELLRGPNSEDMVSAIPEGTEMLSAHTQDGLCAVNFSEQLYKGRPDTVIGERLTVYSIVNSLASLSNVDSVLILIEGMTVEAYHMLSLAEPIERSADVIGPAAGAKGEMDINIYMAADSGQLAAIPRIVKQDAYLSTEMTALRALLQAKSEPGYTSLFFATDRIISADTRSKVCTVALTEDFFTAREDEKAVRLAVDALVATLTDLDGIEAVQLKVGGGPAKYGSLNFTGLLTKNEKIIIE